MSIPVWSTNAGCLRTSTIVIGNDCDCSVIQQLANNEQWLMACSSGVFLFCFNTDFGWINLLICSKFTKSGLKKKRPNNASDATNVHVHQAQARASIVHALHTLCKGACPARIAKKLRADTLPSQRLLLGRHGHRSDDGQNS